MAFFHSNYKNCWKKYSSVALWQPKWYLWNRIHTRRWRLWEWQQELKHSHSSHKRAMNISCINDWEFILQSYTTAKQHPVHWPLRFRCCSPVCCHLVFSSCDEESPVRPSDPHLWHSSTPDSSPVHGEAEPPSPVPCESLPHISTKHMISSSKMKQPKKSFP